jgi:hypothetical protein
VRYYPLLVEFYTVDNKRTTVDREALHLYLLCFVHDRGQRRNDGASPIWAGRLLFPGAALGRGGRCRHHGGHLTITEPDLRGYRARR